MIFFCTFFGLPRIPVQNMNIKHHKCRSQLSTQDNVAQYRVKTPGLKWCDNIFYCIIVRPARKSRKFHNEELNLYSSPNINTEVVWSRRGESKTRGKRNACTILVGKTESNLPIAWRRGKYEGKIKKNTDNYSMNWTQMAQDRVQSPAGNNRWKNAEFLD
jgi:hypothetical protein